MDEMTFYFMKTSPRRMEKAEKFQFLLTAFGLFVGGFDGIANPNRFYVFISFLLIFIGIIFLVLGAFYQKFKLKFKDQSTRLVSFISGIFMILTGISFGLINIRSRVQYFYYLIGLIYIFFYPKIIEKRQKKSQVMINKSGISIGKLSRTSHFYGWEEIKNIKLTPEMLLIQLRNNQQKRFFLTPSVESDFIRLEKQIKITADSNQIEFLVEEN
ncbi:hypothetical protein JW964_17295 [candidate division KSB1 bacterium]|nr:hypothetical protein [candidate division KSB1 bacterium]